MVKVTFVEHDGTRHEVESPEGETIMRVALNNDVPGIVADCGGQCACATCHAYLNEAYFGLAGPVSEEEGDMLECAIDVKPTSRLTCQVVVTKTLNGITVSIPPSQT